MRNSETLIGKVHHSSSLAGQPSLQEKKSPQALSSRGGGSDGAVSVQAISMWRRISSFLEEGSSSVMLTPWSCSQICTCHWFFGRSEVYVIFPWSFIASEVTVYLKSGNIGYIVKQVDDYSRTVSSWSGCKIKVHYCWDYWTIHIWTMDGWIY